MTVSTEGGVVHSSLSTYALDDVTETFNESRSEGVPVAERE